MAFSTISQQYSDKIDSFPYLQGFGAPQQGFIAGNVRDDKKIYSSLAEVQRAAMKNPECTGFTSLPKGGWRLRVRARAGCDVHDFDDLSRVTLLRESKMSFSISSVPRAETRALSFSLEGERLELHVCRWGSHSSPALPTAQ